MGSPAGNLNQLARHVNSGAGRCPFPLAKRLGRNDTASRGKKVKTSDRATFDSGCALSSVVEHYLHTVGVAGSKPAARTIFEWVFFDALPDPQPQFDGPRKLVHLRRV